MVQQAEDLLLIPYPFALIHISLVTNKDFVHIV